MRNYIPITFSFLLILFLISCSTTTQLTKKDFANKDFNTTSSQKYSSQNHVDNYSSEKKDRTAQYQKNSDYDQKNSDYQIQKERTLQQEWSSNNCEGTGNKTLISPIPLEELELITPLGVMIGGHVTPIDHQYWSPKNTDEQGNRKTPVDVLAPASGYIVSIQHMMEYIGDKQHNTPNIDDYRLILEHSCTFYTYFIHVKTISQKILMEFESNRHGQLYAQTRIPIVQGEVLGTIFRSVDFAVIDTTKKLKFIIPEHYVREPWKINTVDPFDYFLEPLRTQLLSKNPRTAIPRGGKIDFDLDGTLIGNWFLEETNGYAGTTQNEYWRGHLAFAYDPFDSTAIIISIGDYEGIAKQFAVKNNSPDPATITIKNGIIHYELVQADYVTRGNRWDARNFASNIHLSTENRQTQAILLAQILTNRTIRVEIFPHAQNNNSIHFTSHSKVYER